MKRVLLVSVAAIGLMAGANVALSQGGSPAAAPGGGAGSVGAGPSGAGTPAARPSAPSGGMTEDRASPSGPAATAPAADEGHQKGAQERTGHPNQKSTQQSPARGDRQGQPGAQQQQESQAPAQQRQSESPSAGGSKQGAAERPMTSKNVSLTTEQKTTIRKTVLTGNAPRVSGHVNFDIKVGVVVPREVRVAPLPATIITIEPEWRGFMYFVSGDQIIVVEPRTLEIVAVLDV